MNATKPAPTVHTSKSGLITITMQFRTANGMWDVTATRQSGEKFATKFFLTEDEAKVYANQLWATDGPAPVPAQPLSLVDLAAEFDATPVAPRQHQNWFQASNQPAGPAASEAQVRFIRSLLAERDVPTTQVEQVTALLDGTMTKSQASTWITALQATPKVERTTAAPAVNDLPDVPAGHYATPSRTGNNDLDFWRVDRPTEGRWAGRTFVKRVIGGHEDQRISFGETRQALDAIVSAGLDEASRAYGQAIGRCGRCNRHLTDEDSRAYGMGPDCRSKGW